MHKQLEECSKRLPLRCVPLLEVRLDLLGELYGRATLRCLPHGVAEGLSLEQRPGKPGKLLPEGGNCTHTSTANVR